MPRYTLATEEEKREQRLVDQEMFKTQVFAIFVAEALNRIWAKWGPLNREDLAAFLGRRSHVEPPLADALARDFLRFFQGDHEGASFTAIPRIEALTRAIVLAIPLPIYRTQRAQTPGQYPGLGVLLPELRRVGLDEPWYRFLYGFFANPRGHNTRNEVLHGFVYEPSETQAALSLIGALYLSVGLDLLRTT